MNEKQASTYYASVDACRAVLEWARTPGKHGQNPYTLGFVKLAEIAVAKHENRKPEEWAQTSRPSELWARRSGSGHDM